MRHHVYLSPGMFGFGRLGSFDYFAHLERELGARFAAAGHEAVMHSVTDLPTASIRRRAMRLAALVRATADGDGPIHLVGHSTGGLDARLVASPVTAGIPPDDRAWLPRLQSLTTMNTPHRGTPLASFFTTTSGQRLLAALSVLTYVGLSVGARPLAAASVLLSVLQQGEQYVPLSPQLLARSMKSIAGLIDSARSPEVRPFLAAIEDDQGSMLQLSPEAMDLVAVAFPDRPGLRLQCTASMAPRPRPRRWLETIGHPWRAVSLAIFTALYRITSAIPDRYPCAATDQDVPKADPVTEALLVRVFGSPPRLEDNDGVVPIRSQLWGECVWAGFGDHLDVLGHYDDKRRARDTPASEDHRDWLTSGSNFSGADFGRLVDAIATGMLA
jgi:triacylglycerol lipase